MSKHPLLKAHYEACLAVERLGCGLEYTHAVSRVSDMGRPIEALVDDLAAAQATIQQQARELEEADKVVLGWMEDNGAIPTEFFAIYKAALARQALRAQQESEAKKEEV